MGRGRWKIENEGFHMHKNIRYDIQHVNSENYNAMKCRYLLTQIADILLQLYERGNAGLRELNYRSSPHETYEMAPPAILM